MHIQVDLCGRRDQQCVFRSLPRTEVKRLQLPPQGRTTIIGWPLAVPSLPIAVFSAYIGRQLPKLCALCFLEDPEEDHIASLVQYRHHHRYRRRPRRRHCCCGRRRTTVPAPFLRRGGASRSRVNSRRSRGSGVFVYLRGVFMLISRSRYSGSARVGERMFLMDCRY